MYTKNEIEAKMTEFLREVKRCMAWEFVEASDIEDGYMKDCFYPFFDYGKRLFYNTYNSTDSSHHINDRQTTFIEKQVEVHQNDYFSYLTAEEQKKFGSFLDYFDWMREQEDKGNHEPLQDFDESEREWINHIPGTLVFDCQFYSKDKVANDTNEDVVYIAANFDVGETICFINKAVRPHFEKAFLLKDFMELGENELYELTEEVLKSVEENRFITDNLCDKIGI
jgi:hypothetical protein